jgi:hypothetical protein
MGRAQKGAVGRVAGERIKREIIKVSKKRCIMEG